MDTNVFKNQKKKKDLTLPDLLGNEGNRIERKHKKSGTERNERGHGQHGQFWRTIMFNHFST